MRRLALLVPVLLALVPAGAAAKEGAVVSPALSAMTPGEETPATIYVMPYLRGRREVRAPRSGVRPVLVLRSGRLVLRFRGTPTAGGSSAVAVTVPGPPGRRWSAALLVSGRDYPLESQHSFAAGADSAALLDGQGTPAGQARTLPWPLAVVVALLAWR